MHRWKDNDKGFMRNESRKVLDYLSRGIRSRDVNRLGRPK